MATIHTFKAVCPDFEQIDAPDEFFNLVKYQFSKFWKEDLFKTNPENAFYIYQQSHGGGTHTGLVACASIHDYLQGDIVRHEQTIVSKERSMTQLMEERQALIKPVLLTYPSVPEISTLLKSFMKQYPALYTVNYKRAIHTFWAVSEPEHVEQISHLFATKVPKTYIADGHHRCATMSTYYKRMKEENENHKGDEPYNFLLSAFFAEDEVNIHAFNRVVHTLNNHSPESLRKSLRKYFVVRKLLRPRRPRHPEEIGMYINRKWYSMRPRRSFKKRFKSLKERLSVSLLDKTILKGMLGIKDIRNDTRINYVEAPKGLGALEKRVATKTDSVAFSLHPIHLSDLTEVADAKEVMPPKSTWIEPRIRNGLIIHKF